MKSTNKNIKKIVQKMVVTYKNLHEMFPYMIHVHCPIVRTLTRATIYILVYRIKIVMLFKVRVFFMRVLIKAKLEHLRSVWKYGPTRVSKKIIFLCFELFRCADHKNNFFLNIILIYFDMKSFLKINHTSKQAYQ
jgi:hypothetical protein